MRGLDVSHDLVAVARALDLARSRIPAARAKPGFAESLAPEVGLTWREVDYPLHVLEELGLLERGWGGLRERIMVATADSYVVPPAALGPVATDPERSRDRLSASNLEALDARAGREVAD